MRVVSFYHAYLDNEVWPDIVGEHLEALESFDGKLIVGAAGAPPAQQDLRDMLGDRATVVTVDASSEHDTMEMVRYWARANPEDLIAYAHTKGASQPTEFNDRWRRSMQHFVVEGWQDCVAALEDGHDAVGCHWLHPDEFGEKVMGPVPFFGGNYWVARCEYLATLPPVPTEDRFGSERWIGLGDKPRVQDLCPGWPGDAIFYVEDIAA